MQSAEQGRQIEAPPPNSTEVPLVHPTLARKASADAKTVAIPLPTDPDGQNLWLATWLILKSHRYLQTLTLRLEARLPKAIILSVSTAALIVHAALQIYLMKEFTDDSMIAMCSALILGAIAFFAAFSVAKLLYTVLDKVVSMCVHQSYLLSALIYFLFSFVTLAYMSSVYQDYAIGIICLVLVACNTMSAFIVCAVIILIAASVIFVFEAIVRLATCKLNLNLTNTTVLKYETYLYDKKMTRSPECTICLHEFKEEDVICMLRCHDSHIFHEACIIEWIGKQPICPICRAPASFL